MKLTWVGENCLGKKHYRTFNDYNFRRHGDNTWQVHHYGNPLVPFAIHEGTAAETMRLFKIELITRRLTA